jgi:hypothetical protein
MYGVSESVKDGGPRAAETQAEGQRTPASRGGGSAAKGSKSYRSGGHRATEKEKARPRGARHTGKSLVILCAHREHFFLFLYIVMHAVHTIFLIDYVCALYRQMKLWDLYSA